MLLQVTSGYCGLPDRFPVFLSGCGAPYGTIGGVQLAPDRYRVSFSPTGYISWDLAYRSALLRCAELTIQRGYRSFGVLVIENYSSVNSFGIPKNSYAHGFYNASTAYNPPQPQHHLDSARSDH